MASWKTLGLGGGWLTNEALGNRVIKDVIGAISVEEFEGNKQLVADLLNENIKVAFNKHSLELWDAAYGDDYDKWVSQPIIISLKMVKVRGQMTQIKVLEPAPVAVKSKRK